MKSFKFLNTITGLHTIVTEQGKRNFESDASLSKQMKFIGECDVQGVLLKKGKAEEVAAEAETTIEEVVAEEKFVEEVVAADKKKKGKK